MDKEFYHDTFENVKIYVWNKGFTHIGDEQFCECQIGYSNHLKIYVGYIQFWGKRDGIKHTCEISHK